MDDSIADRIDFLLETEKLKNVLRRSSPAHSDRLENSAEHSWSLGIMALLFADLADEPVNRERVLELVAVHDLVEIDAGDTFCYDAAANAGKPAREQAAADRLFGLLPVDAAERFRQLWEEFEDAATPEARFANAVDRLLPLIQHREHGGAQWQAHAISTDQVLARIAPIAGISTTLHRYALTIVAEAEQKRWLIPAENQRSRSTP